MKFYITKYALTQGILVKEAEIYSECPTMIVTANPHMHYHKPD
jgi:hypothetical protein